MRSKGLVGLGVCAVLAFVGMAADAGAKQMAGWKVSGGAGGTELHSGAGYNLYNTDQKGYLKLQDRWGANLGWQSDAKKNIEIKNKGGGAIKCGEPVAIKVDSEWMIYGSQDFGINLTTRTKLDDGHYQWTFDCAAGQTVKLDQPVSISNTHEKDALVGCKRVKGVNLCWADDVESRAGFNFRKKG
jgi:hypothetical protein